MLRHIPNLLTLLRLVLCVGLFGILIHAQLALGVQVDVEGELSPERLGGRIQTAHHSLRAGGSPLGLLLDLGLALFILAYLTDILDGKIARSYGVVSELGRIADPIADKILVLGSFVLLVPLTVHVEGWIVVVIATREFLVTGLRSYASTRGKSIPVNWWGKTKMFAQSFAIGTGIFHVAHPGLAFAEWILIALVWGAVIATVASGARYCLDAKRVLGGEAA